MDLKEIIKTHEKIGMLEIEDPDAKEAFNELEKSVYNSNPALAKMLRDYFYIKYKAIAKDIEKYDPTFWISVNAFIAKENISVS